MPRLDDAPQPLVAYKPPYPWFGGKSKVAAEVWSRFGDPKKFYGGVRNYVEPFFGSGAILMLRPGPIEGTETVNDLDGFVANFWRALQASPDEVAKWTDWPVNENDLHARHIWLVERKESLGPKLEGDPNWFDAKIAGWWCWGLCCWIGSGWCSGKGPWGVVTAEDGTRQLAHLGNAGQGVNRKRAHLGSAGQGVNRKRGELTAYFAHLADRLRGVRVCCGDWERVCGPTPTVKMGLTAVFLDPPYSAEAGRAELYRKEDWTVAHRVREWCKERGSDKRMRIALCGYEGEGHEELEPLGWSVLAWKAHCGYGGQRKDGDNANARRERIWFSPHCACDIAEPPRRIAKTISW